MTEITKVSRQVARAALRQQEKTSKAKPPQFRIVYPNVRKELRGTVTPTPTTHVYNHKSGETP